MKPQKTEKEGPKLYWHQSLYAWIAKTKRGADDKITKPVEPVVETLCRRLISIRGEAACVYINELPIMHSTLLWMGRIISPSSVKLQRGAPSDCHRNVARLWKRNKSRFTMYTGYSFSEDKMWRPHSWLLDQRGRIIETTVKARMYFGVPLFGDCAEVFLKRVN